MGNDNEAFIHWIAVSNQIHNGNIRFCRTWFWRGNAYNLLKTCSIIDMKKHSTLYLQLDKSNKTTFNFYTKLGFVKAINSNDMQNQIKYIEKNLSFDFNEKYYVYPLDNNNNVTHKLYSCTSKRFGPNKTEEIFNEPETIDKQEEIKQEQTKQNLVEIDSDKIQEENKQKLVKNDSYKIVYKQQLFLWYQNLLHLKGLENYEENYTKQVVEYNNVWVLYPGSEKDICHQSLTTQPVELIFANCPCLKQHLITEEKEKPLTLPSTVNSILSSLISCDDQMYKQVDDSFLVWST